MLRPEYLEELPDEILELFSEAEQEILADMARRISTYDFWIPAADHQNRVLREAGIMQEDILTVLSATTRKSEEELRDLMQRAGSMALHNDESIYSAGGFHVPSIKDSLPLRNVLNAGYQATATEMANLCRTTARTATKQFEDALDRAWLNVSSGAFDADAAIRSAVKELSEKGIQSITYPSGRTDSIETAVRRAVVTGVNQTAGQLQIELADELGCDLVEVTAHSDARPEHALWQGRIYSRSGKHPNYPPFVASTGYGTGDGLCGWNCRHSFGPYIEGSPPVYTQEELDKLDEPTIEYDGKKMTEYEARQRMRYNERQIRRWKREEVALNAAGLDSSEAAAKVSAWQARQRDFVDQTGFKRQYGLEQISVANQDQSGILGTETTNLAKAIDSILLVDDVSEHKYTPSEILEEMQKSPIGIETIRFIRDSDALICIVDEIQMHSDRGSQEGNVINIFSANIKNQRVAGQTVIHEIAHLRYQIGHCQHAEAICFAMEKMHLLGRNYLTTEEWEQMVALAKYAYPEYGWEDGGYGDFSKFNFVSE